MHPDSQLKPSRQGRPAKDSVAFFGQNLPLSQATHVSDIELDCDSCPSEHGSGKVWPLPQMYPFLQGPLTSENPVGVVESAPDIE